MLNSNTRIKSLHAINPFISFLTEFNYISKIKIRFQVKRILFITLNWGGKRTAHIHLIKKEMNYFRLIKGNLKRETNLKSFYFHV